MLIKKLQKLIFRKKSSDSQPFLLIDHFNSANFFVDPKNILVIDVWV